MSDATRREPPNPAHTPAGPDERSPDPIRKGRSRDRLLNRWLAGEMNAAEARAFAARLDADPGLARAAEARLGVWRHLEVPDGAAGEAVPPGFAGRVMARVRDEATVAGAGAGGLSTAWSRVVGAGALAAGLALGLAIGPVQGVAPFGSSDAPLTAVATETAAPGDLWDGDSLLLAAAYGDLYSDLDSGGAEVEASRDAETSTVSLVDDYAAAFSSFGDGEGS